MCEGCTTFQQRIADLEARQKDLSDNLHRLTNTVQARLLKIELRNLGLRLIEAEPETETERHDDRHQQPITSATRRTNSDDARENQPAQWTDEGNAVRATGDAG